MALSAAFKALAQDPWGEAQAVRVSVRLNDGTGGIPGTLVVLTTACEALAVNPVVRERERRFGVMQGQTWQVRLSDPDKTLAAYALADCWCAIEAGFPTADVWELMAQGKVTNVERSTDLTVTLTIADAIMRLLQYKLPRDIKFTANGWAGLVRTVSKADDSHGYNNDWDDDQVDEGVVVTNYYDIQDETFQIVFTSATAFKVVCEDATEQTGFSISSDAAIESCKSSAEVVEVKAAGWDTASGAYASGDTFVFYTAAGREASVLSPIGMIAHLIFDIVDAQVYDVLDGSYYGSAAEEYSYWTAQAALIDDSTISGEFTKGDNVADLIQDLLPLFHGCLFPTRSGRFGLWVLSPTTVSDFHFNGDPAAGDVHILSGSTQDVVDGCCTRVAYSYKELSSGEDAEYEAVDADPSFDSDMPAKVSTRWWVNSGIVEAAANKYLNRFKTARREYLLEMTLAGASADLCRAIEISEPTLALASVKTDVQRVAMDLMNNAVALSAYTDPVSQLGYAVVGTSVVGGADVVW